MCDPHPLIAAYELGELWAELGYHNSVLNAFPDDDELLRIYNGQITVLAPRFEQVFPEGRPAEVGQFFQQLQRSNPTLLAPSSGPHDSTVDELQRAFVETDDLDIVRNDFLTEQLQGIRYRDLTLYRLLDQPGPEVQRRIRALTLGQWMSECLFPRDIITRMFELRLDDKTQEIVLLTHRPDPSAVLLTDAALRGVRDALWQLQPVLPQERITPKLNQTHALLNRQVTEVRNEFQSLRTSILEVLQSLPEAAAMAAPSSSHPDEVEWGGLRVNSQSGMMSWPGLESIRVAGGPELRLLVEMIQAKGQCQQKIIADRLWPEGDVDSYEQLKKIRSSLDRQFSKLFGTTDNKESSYLVAANPNGGKKKYGPQCTLTLRLPTPPESLVSPPPPGQPSSAPNPTEVRSG